VNIEKDNKKINQRTVPFSALKISIAIDFATDSGTNKTKPEKIRNAAENFPTRLNTNDGISKNVLI
jgi:hypothetical protein